MLKAKRMKEAKDKEEKEAAELALQESEKAVDGE